MLTGAVGSSGAILAPIFSLNGSMNTKQNRFAFLACLLLAFAVTLGAFGAHWLRPLLGEQQLEVWKTAVLYHFVHSVGMLVLALADPDRFRLANRLLFAGTVCFSGSLYGLSIPAVQHGAFASVLGPITPLGGLCFAAGWITAALAIKKDRKA